MSKKIIFLLLLSFLAVLGSSFCGLNLRQSVILGIFVTSILGTLFFWELRLSFIFIGSGLLFLIHAINLEQFIQFASLDVILFLIGMMIIVAMLEEAGLFNWLVSKILTLAGLNGRRLFGILMILSFVLSGIMGEVTSILIMGNTILLFTELLEINPTPLIISSVLCTNIGSATTVMGNPIGVLIALRGKLTFESFISHALSASFLILLVVIALLLFWHRKYIKFIDQQLRLYTENELFQNLITTRTSNHIRTSLIIFALTVIAISLHHRLELLAGLEENTLLIIIPIIFAGLVLLIYRHKLQYFVETKVDWLSLLFFMFLFAQAGVLRYSGIGNILAEKILKLTGANKNLLVGGILFSSGLISSVLDNTVTVSSFIPVLLGFGQERLKALWWALLFGACYGGNITLIGSTANIVALGLLNKKTKIKVSAMEWLKIGLVIGLLSMLVAYLAIIFLPIFS